MNHFFKIISNFFIISLVLYFVPLKALALSGPEDPYSFSAVSGQQSGSVTIRWYDDGNAKQYNLFYGTDPSHYAYGVVDLPDAANTSNAFTINYLTPGVTYYFSLVGLTAAGATTSGPVAAEATTANQTTNIVTNHLPEYGFTAQTGTTPGTILLTWTDNASAEKYDIVYGTSPNSLPYGVENIPFNPNMDNAFPVGALQSGTRYYFSLVAEKNGSIILWSNPVSAIAK